MAPVHRRQLIAIHLSQLLQKGEKAVLWMPQSNRRTAAATPRESPRAAQGRRPRPPRAFSRHNSDKNSSLFMSA